MNKYYRTYNTRVVKLTMEQAEQIANADNQFVIRGRYHAKTPRSKFIGKHMDVPQTVLNDIQQKLKTQKRRYFTLEVARKIGISPEVRAIRYAEQEIGLKKCRGRKISHPDKAKGGTVIHKQTYLCQMTDGKVFVKALML